MLLLGLAEQAIALRVQRIAAEKLKLPLLRLQGVAIFPGLQDLLERDPLGVLQSVLKSPLEILSGECAAVS